MLGQARESALELRAKAEEHARRVVREAQETARELRTTTQQAVEAKTREAEDAARARAKEIVGEARALRERVLGDLNERRQELERQIAELRGGRGKLVETYELGRARARARGARDGGGAVDTARRSRGRRGGGDRRRACGDGRTSSGRHARPAPNPRRNRAPEPATDERGVRDRRRRAADRRVGRRAAPDVGALFEKLRSGQSDDAPVTAAGSADPTDDAPRRVGAGRDAAAAADAEAPNRADADVGGVGGHRRARHRGPRRRARRHDRRPRAPRASERSRTSRTTCSTACVASGARSTPPRSCPPLEDQLARWAHVLQPAVDAAYAAGAASVGPRPAVVRRRRRPGPSSPSSPTSVVTPLRERLESSLESDRRPHAGRHRDRDRPEPRCPVPRVAGRAARRCARRRARGGVLPGRVRRRARRCAVCGGCRRSSASAPTATTTRSNRR